MAGRPKDPKKDWPYCVTVFAACRKYNPDGDGVGDLEGESVVKVFPLTKKDAGAVIADVMSRAQVLKDANPVKED